MRVMRLPLSVFMGSAWVSPDSVETRAVSIKAFSTKALPVWRWQSRQVQQWTNMGAYSRR